VNDDALRDLIRGVFLGGDDAFPLPADLDLVANGICDSFALLEMAMALEQRNGLVIPDSDVTVENFGSIDRIKGYLEAKMA
jgi:acyl carrier protein